MPDVSGVTVVTNSRVYYTTRAAADAPSVRHSLRPLTGGQGILQQDSGEMRREIAKLRFVVIARSKATKQSILSLLQHGLLRFARNDGQQFETWLFEI
jgi:hypothetical protein